MKFASKFLVFGLYTAYMTGCSVDTKSASELKQDFPSACQSNSAPVQAVMTAVNAQDCGKAMEEIAKVPSLKTDKAIDADLIATAVELKTLEVPLVAGTESLASLANLSKLETLTILNSSLKSLKGIEGLKGLKYVAIVSPSLKSIDIAGPASVTSLWIDSESLENIDNLANFTALESLQIFTSKPLSLTALKSLPKLKSLWIKSEGAIDLSPLRGLPLKNLMVYNDSITQVSSFEGLAALDTLTIKSNALQSINGLSSLSVAKSLKSLQLVATAVSDLAEVSKIPSLNGLATVDGKNLSIPFASLKASLKDLNVSGSTLNLSDANFAGFDKLNNLSIDASNFPLEQLQAPNLTYLTTSQTKRNGSDFAAFGKLEYLSAESASLTNISGLTNKPELSFLALSHNSVQNFKELEASQKLVYADISYNTIPDGFTFPQIERLDTIIAHHNNFVDLKPFKQQLNLFELDVSHTSTNYEKIDNLFTTDIGEDRSLWLSLVRCQGIAVASEQADCSKTFSVPTGDTTRIFQYEAKNIERTLQSERAHIEALEKLAVNINPVDPVNCVWVSNHIEMLNNLNQSVETNKELLASVFNWENASSSQLLKKIVNKDQTEACAKEECTDLELNAYYKFDISQCLNSGIDPVTRTLLSKEIKSAEELKAEDRTDNHDVSEGAAPVGKSGSLDYLTGSDDPSQAFLAYLRNLEIKLKLWSETSTNSQVALKEAIDGAKKALGVSLGEAQSFLSKIERLEDTLRTRIGTLREQLVNMMKEPAKK